MEVADRPRAEDDDRLREGDPRLPRRADDAGEGFGERQDLGRDVVWRGDHEPPGHRDVVGEGAVRRDAELPHGRAVQDLVPAAPVAAPAADVHVDDDGLAFGQPRDPAPERRDVAGELVARDQREPVGGVGPVEDVEVRAADARPRDADEGLALAGIGARNVPDVEAPGRHEDGGAHGAHLTTPRSFERSMVSAMAAMRMTPKTIR
jgi:hypothetical protein